MIKILILFVFLFLASSCSVEESKNAENSIHERHSDSTMDFLPNKKKELYFIEISEFSVSLVREGTVKVVPFTDFENTIYNLLKHQYIELADTSTAIAFKLNYPKELKNKFIVEVVRAISSSYKNIWDQLSIKKYGQKYNSLDRKAKKNISGKAPYLVSGKTPELPTN